MPTPPQTRTATYPEDARQYLGNAITCARLAAGFNSRAEFARAANVSKRSIDALETGEPVVGHRTLTHVGRTLSHHIHHWSEDTPLHILQGQPAPPNDLRTPSHQPAPDPTDPNSQLQPLRVTDMHNLLRTPIDLLHHQGMTQSDVRTLISTMLLCCTGRGKPQVRAGDLGDRVCSDRLGRDQAVFDAVVAGVVPSTVVLLQVPQAPLVEVSDGLLGSVVPSGIRLARNRPEPGPW